MGNTIIENPIQIKLIKRIYVIDEKIETGKILYCSDTLEAFFDENTKTRICLGKTSSINSENELETPSEKDIGSFKIILDTLSIKYCDSSLTWRSIETRDEMTQALGSVDKFEPHNLIKSGKLIAPRTLATCVYDDYGIPIGETLNYLQDIIEKLLREGIPAELITSGIIDVGRIPKEARFDFYPVEDTAERLSLTNEQIQNGDVVQEESTKRMFFVIDDTKLGTEAAFREFTVGSIPWASVLNRPLSITLKDGANGTALLSTSSSTESQKITISVKLNMDYADSGILPTKYGGTGNQTGTAQYIDADISDLDKLYLAGFKSNNKMGRSPSISFQAGLFTTPAICTDDNIPSAINKLRSDDIILDKPNGVKTLTAYDDTTKNYYNLVSYKNNTGITIGDKAQDTKIEGNDTIIHSSSHIYAQVGDVAQSQIELDKNRLKINVPAQIYDSFVIRSENSNDFIITTDQTFTVPHLSPKEITTNNPNLKGTINIASYPVTHKNMTVFDNEIDGFIFKCTNSKNTYIGKDGFKGDRIEGTALVINGDANIKGIIHGCCSQATNADTLDGYQADYFMRADGRNNTNPPVVIQASAPAGRTNCLWINSSSGVANYWTGKNWTPISNTWKNS